MTREALARPQCSPLRSPLIASNTGVVPNGIVCQCNAAGSRFAGKTTSRSAIAKGVLPCSIAIRRGPKAITNIGSHWVYRHRSPCGCLGSEDQYEEDCRSLNGVGVSHHSSLPVLTKFWAQGVRTWPSRPDGGLARTDHLQPARLNPEAAHCGRPTCPGDRKLDCRCIWFLSCQSPPRRRLINFLVRLTVA